MVENLSNTATPRYYGAFKAAVLRGEIPVNYEISLEMNRIDGLIADPNIWYDDRAVDGFISYCEQELTLTDGEPLRLLPIFKVWAEQVFAWWRFETRQVPEKNPETGIVSFVDRMVKMRLTTKQYLIVARGAAKSMYASCIQSYFLNVDTNTTHQITTAPTMKQAEEVLGPIRTSITRARGPLFQFLTEGSLQNTTGAKADRTKLSSTKKGIENFLTGSLLEVRPMSINKLQGLRPKCSTIDEWLSGDLREDVIGALEQGASRLQNYFILAISSEGTVRNGSGDTVKMELADILKSDENYAPHYSIWHYKLDKLEEVDDPAMWPKANPNIGKTVPWSAYQQDYERMHKVPAALNDILAKRFGIPREGFSYFFAYEETEPSRTEQSFNGMPCSMGVDLSQGDDFCAFTFLFPMVDGSVGIKTRSYITTNTLHGLQSAMRFKYEQFQREGSLIILDMPVLDMMAVYDDLEQHIIEHDYVVQCVGYDPYNAKEFINRWETENHPYGVEKVIQGARTESVPLGELKKMAEQRLLIFDQALFSFAMGNAITLEDTNGNRKLLKKRHEEKIDNVAAALDAWVAYKLHKDAFE